MAERSAITVRVQAEGAAAVLVDDLAAPATATTPAFVRGGSAALDGKEGLFYWDPTSTATADGAITIGTGTGRHKRVRRGREFNVLWFGARTDLTTASDTALITANTAAIQACIDAAIAAGCSHVIMPAGVYVINSTIHLGRPTLYSSIVLEGEGYKSNNVGVTAGTFIHCTHSDSPAINVQGSRGSVIRALGIKGQLYDWIADRGLALAGCAYDDTDPDEWDDPDLAANAESRYAPYAAITVDGWAGVQPATHYPTTFRAYGGDFSSDVLIEDCKIIGFNTAVANQPSNVDGNGDFTSLRRVLVEYCKYVFSVGNSQSRNVNLTDVKAGVCFCILTNNHHGKQTGKFGGAITNLSSSATLKLFEFGNSAYFGPLMLNGFYAEGMWRIGEMETNGSAETSITFNECYFGMGGQTEARGIPPTLIGGYGNTIHVEFNGGTINTFPCVASFVHPDIVFNGTRVIPHERRIAPGKAYQALFDNATCGVVFPQLKPTSNQRIQFSRNNIDTLTNAGTGMVQNGMRRTNRTECIPLWCKNVDTLAGNYANPQTVPWFVTSVAKSSTTCTLTQDGTKKGELRITFTSLTEGQAARFNREPGDVVWDDETGTVFAIRAREQVGGVGEYRSLVCEIQSNYRLTAGVYNCPVAFSTTTGNFYFGNSRVYTPTYPVIADITAGSAVLTNAGRDDAYATFLTADVLANDRPLIDPESDNWVSSNAKVSAVDAGALTITLDTNVSAGRTKTRKRIPFFMRAPEANEASR